MTIHLFVVKDFVSVLFIGVGEQLGCSPNSVNNPTK